MVKRTGDGAIVEFRSVLDAVRCAIEVQQALIDRNAGSPPDRRIEFRIGIHVGDVVEESDGDLMGDGVNIAARLEGIPEPGGICLSEDAYRQVRDRVKVSIRRSRREDAQEHRSPGPRLCGDMESSAGEVGVQPFWERGLGFRYPTSRRSRYCRF